MTDTFNSAYVAGMTRIPQRTIREYVSAFRGHFSATAGQATKGRRFTAADIAKLQTIQRLRRERWQDDQIAQALAGEIELPQLAHQFDPGELLKVAANGLELNSHTNALIEQAQEEQARNRDLLITAQRTLQQCRNENQALKNQLDEIKLQLKLFKEWQIYVMGREPDFNNYKPDDPKEPMPEITAEKKPGFLSKILK